jgi:5'-methylthioadenosine phosphorylase
MSSPSTEAGAVGIIGGSGVYEMEGLADVSEIRVETPFGAPSDALVRGVLDGRTVYFLPRHGRGHRLLPHELPVRANIWAMKSLGVDWILSISAVGSLKEEIRPRDVVIPTQLFDRTRCRPSTFFGEGIAAHISLADPFCPVLRSVLLDACRRLGLPLKDGGTYVSIEGPAFSTKAESEVNRKMGFDIVGMTALPEARLAREAEIAYAMVALSTDYDVWHESGEVSVELVLENLRANTANVKKLIRAVMPHIPSARTSPAQKALDGAIMTDPALWPAATVERLAPILARVKGGA